jgi:hypothetical protein
MLKQTITYDDFNDVSHTEDFYFNLSKRELLEMEMIGEGGQTMQDYLQTIIDSGDNKQILEEFKKIVLKAYGVRSADGTMFSKSEEATEQFENSGAMDELLVQFFQDATVASNFVNGVLPADLQGAVAASQATNGFRPGADTSQPTPPVAGAPTASTPVVAAPVASTPAAPVTAPVTAPTPVPVSDPTPVDTTPVAADPTPAPVDTPPASMSDESSPIDTTPVAAAPVEAVPDPTQDAAPVDAAPVPTPSVQTELNDPSWPVDNAPVSTDPTQALPLDGSSDGDTTSQTGNDVGTTADSSSVSGDGTATDQTSQDGTADATSTPASTMDPRLLSDGDDSPLFSDTAATTGVTPAVDPNATQQ